MKKISTKKRRPSIPSDTKTKLWLFSGGRCQFEGCNEALWRDDLTFREMNRSYIGHIYGYAEGSARYDKKLSPKLEKDFSNLMLLCDPHHRLIDNKEHEAYYSARKLIGMKNEHEKRIERLTRISPDKKSHIIFFGAKIGNHNSPFKYIDALEAMIPDFYPASDTPIELGLTNSSFKDSEEDYWNFELKNLESLFRTKVESLKSEKETKHFSIFGLAPQPLLIKLGTLFSDLYSAQIYQLHREPSTWKWLGENVEVKHIIIEPNSQEKKVALKLELSADIIDDRITEVINEKCSIWSISHKKPNNDYIRNKSNLQNFREAMREAFNRIKKKHGENVILHVFPAMPVSTAIELGRVWMPKADLPMIIYDQNKHNRGFHKTIKIVQGY